MGSWLNRLSVVSSDELERKVAENTRTDGTCRRMYGTVEPGYKSTGYKSTPAIRAILLIPVLSTML